MGWVTERVGCTTAGFLRRLREAACEDVLEANQHFEPSKVFSLSCADAKDLQVNRRHKGETDYNAFVLFKPAGENAITVSLHYRNGTGRALFSERPMGRITLEWDYRRHECAIKLCGEDFSFVDLRQKTLGELFFG